MIHVLVAIATVVAYGVFVLIFPTRACPSCARRRGRCPRCAGTGRRFRPGARLVHRGAVQARNQARRKSS